MEIGEVKFDVKNVATSCNQQFDVKNWSCY